MEFQPIIKQQSPHKGIHWEAQPPKEVRHEHHALTGLGTGNDLPLNRQPMRNFAGQELSLPQLHYVLLRDGGGRPSALKVRTGHCRRSEAPGIWSLGCWNSRRRANSFEIGKRSKALVSL